MKNKGNSNALNVIAADNEKFPIFIAVNKEPAKDKINIIFKYIILNFILFPILIGIILLLNSKV